MAAPPTGLWLLLLLLVVLLGAGEAVRAGPPRQGASRAQGALPTPRFGE